MNWNLTRCESGAYRTCAGFGTPSLERFSRFQLTQGTRRKRGFRESGLTGTGRSECRKPPGENVKQQPRPPGESSQALSPSDPVAGQKENHHHQKYSVQQDSVGAVGGLFGLLVYFGSTERLNNEYKYYENKSEPDIQHAPPFGPGLGIFDERSNKREDAGYQEHCRSPDCKALLSRLTHGQFSKPLIRVE